MQQILTSVVVDGEAVSGSTQQLEGETKGELSASAVVIEKGKKYLIQYNTTYVKQEVEE